MYGNVVRRRLRAMGIRDKPISAGSPWQNCFAERLIGSIRRECVEHLTVFGEQHLRRVLRSYALYYNDIRTHRSLNRTHRYRVPFNGSGASHPVRLSAGYTTNTSESEFSVHTGKKEILAAIYDASYEPSVHSESRAPGLRNALSAC
jgi:hypothetical protein